jgi:hypothetical protein
MLGIALDVPSYRTQRAAENHPRRPVLVLNPLAKESDASNARVRNDDKFR